MSDLETFGGSVERLDPLYQKQKEDVAKMRASLLSCSDTSISTSSAKQALKNITGMRIYHQLSRIIRYLDMMDKIEDKLYASIDATLDNINESSPSAWMMLINLQEKLQKNMIESHKLLEPYLNLLDNDVIDMISQPADSTPSQNNVLPAQSREKLRDAANKVLIALESEENRSNSVDNSSTSTQEDEHANTGLG